MNELFSPAALASQVLYFSSLKISDVTIATSLLGSILYFLKSMSMICSLGEEPVKITEEASRDKFQVRFQKHMQAKTQN